MSFRVRAQLAEALGPVNQWYCSQCYGRKIEDPEVLLLHFINRGGAADFAARYREAMGPLNRWYCSEFYGREITDPEILWAYYMTCKTGGSAVRQLQACATVNDRELSVA